MDGWMGGWVDGCVSGCMFMCMCVCVYVCVCPGVCVSRPYECHVRVCVCATDRPPILRYHSVPGTVLEVFPMTMASLVARHARPAARLSEGQLVGLGRQVCSDMYMGYIGPTHAHHRHARTQNKHSSSRTIRSLSFLLADDTPSWNRGGPTTRHHHLQPSRAPQLAACGHLA